MTLLSINPDFVWCCEGSCSWIGAYSSMKGIVFRNQCLKNTECKKSAFGACFERVRCSTEILHHFVMISIGHIAIMSENTHLLAIFGGTLLLESPPFGEGNSQPMVWSRCKCAQKQWWFPATISHLLGGSSQDLDTWWSDHPMCLSHRVRPFGRGVPP